LSGGVMMVDVVADGLPSSGQLAVPEPASFALLGFGLAATAALGRWKVKVPLG
jgi:hypothetical protein